MKEESRKEEQPRKEEQEREVIIPTARGNLHGTLIIPPKARGLVLFVHGSGSSRFSPRNRLVAGVLQQTGFATLLLDLLTEQEEAIDEKTRKFRFNIPLLAERVVRATSWLKKNQRTKLLPLGYFGASTGAAAALMAAAKLGRNVTAIVSRGGRPDLALAYCPQVNAPTLLIVGEWDEPVIEMNKAALEKLKCEKKLVIVPGATHLFEEPGKLEEVAHWATAWFKKWVKR